MKKLLGIMAITALAASAFAQGTVTIGNQTGLVKSWTSMSDQTIMSVAKGSGFVELIAAPKGTSLTPLFTYSGALNNIGTMHYGTLSAFLAANTAWAVPSGANNPGPVGLGPGVFANANATINNILPGASADYIMLGWNGTATTVDGAIAAWNAGTAMFGESAIATTTTADPTATPAGLPVSLKGTFAGVTLIGQVPEPSTFALAGLGAAAMLILRRRK
jgi:hypothetical protein